MIGTEWLEGGALGRKEAAPLGAGRGQAGKAAGANTILQTLYRSDDLRGMRGSLGLLG